MDKKTPKVTVLMPVYNGERYLREAIDSILSQTFQDFEFLIINDGSTDSTREIICYYDDPRIRLLDNECNLGLTRSLNKGLKLAEGEFIARQDGDDISEPERLAKQVAFLDTQPEVALVGTFYKMIDDRGNLIGKEKKPTNYTQICWDLLFCCTFIHTSVMFRKSTIQEQIGFYNEAVIYAQDYDLWCRIARSLKVVNISEYLVKLRLNPSSMTATYGSMVEDEPRKIRAENIAHLLGCEQANIWSDAVQLRAMYSLFWSGDVEELKSLSLQDVSKTIEEIFRLHRAFCQYYKLNQLECINHYTQVCYRLSNHLLRLADYYSHQDKHTAWQFLMKSFLLNRRFFLKKTYIRIVLQLFFGFRTVSIFRQFSKKTT